LRRQLTVAITDSPFENADKEQTILERIGAEVRRFHCTNESKVIEAARNAHVIMCDTSPVTRKVIETLPELVGVVEYGIGYDNIDVNAATENGVLVCNVPDFMTSEVADHTVALILALTRKLNRMSRSTRRGEWNWREFRPISALDGKTIGIIGFGRIGRQVAERMRSFGTQVIAYDPYVTRETMEKLGARPCELDGLLENSDIVSIHTPLTQQTRQLIGKRELAKLKCTAVLVYTSRGSVIDQEALVEALSNGRIGAAGLDVLAREPPTGTEPILKLENVIVTPHAGWYSEESSSRLQENAALEAERLLTGKMPNHPVNKDALLRRKLPQRTA
jgi:D-3-phosphoglycerate dehydrogenase